MRTSAAGLEGGVFSNPPPSAPSAPTSHSHSHCFLQLDLACSACLHLHFPTGTLSSTRLRPRIARPPRAPPFPFQAPTALAHSVPLRPVLQLRPHKRLPACPAGGCNAVGGGRWRRRPRRWATQRVSMPGGTKPASHSSQVCTPSLHAAEHHQLWFSSNLFHPVAISVLSECTPLGLSECTSMC